ncbi:MAG TPA: Tol-Pal system beta propeller repeat protein TolB [Thermoanaerobaculia bacterium]
MRSVRGHTVARLLGTAAAILSCAAALGARAQQQAGPPTTPIPSGGLVLKITKEGGHRLPLAVPPLAIPGMVALQSKVIDPFTATLRSDLEYAQVFTVIDPLQYPSGFRDPTTPQAADRWLGTGAELLVDTRGDVAGDRVSVEARIWDLKSHKMVLGRRYSGGIAYVERIAHTLANDLVKEFTGQNGLFLSTIVFVSDRDGSKELYAMDFDGRNPRRLTAHKSLVLNPDARSGKIVFTSYVHRFPQLWIMNADGTGSKEIPTGVELNASPALSPDGTLIAFAGSAKGNVDVYTVSANGGGLKRLTTTHALEASPDWSPTGRQIAYTSDQTGTPQIWEMDAEGTGPRRLTYAGNWNDEVAWSPRGDKIAFACRNEGDFNICVMDMASGKTTQLTSEGSNGHPGWSPDGEKIVYQSRRGSSTQIYTMDATDGGNKKVLTQTGINMQPVWMSSQ